MPLWGSPRSFAGLLLQGPITLGPMGVHFLSYSLDPAIFPASCRTLFAFCPQLLLLRLRQHCDHPSLVTAPAPDHSNLKAEDMAQLLDLLHSAGEEVCSVCLDPITQAVITACKHMFCTECMQQLLGSGHNTCPLCRTPLERVLQVCVGQCSASVFLCSHCHHQCACASYLFCWIWC